MGSSPGYVMRGIKRAFLVSPDAQLRMSELFAWSYPRLTAPERKHYEVIGRAAKKLAVRLHGPHRRDPKTGRFSGAIWRLRTPEDD